MPATINSQAGLAPTDSLATMAPIASQAMKETTFFLAALA